MFLLSVLLPILSFAANDSVAVILRADKALVQVNEAGAQRLGRLFEAFGAGTDLKWESPSGDFFVDCGRRQDAATCIFRFHPSEQVAIGEKEMHARYACGSACPANFSIAFQGSRGHRFELVASNGELRAFGKRP